MHIKITLRYSKLLEIALSIYFGNGLIATCTTSGILLILHLSLYFRCNLVHIRLSNLRYVILRLGEVLEFSQSVLLIDDSITNHHAATRSHNPTCLLLSCPNWLQWAADTIWGQLLVVLINILRLLLALLEMNLRLLLLIFLIF